ncbi:hypothetical protein GBA63_15265 [Rubrobacter tropicus]|uniref:Uncharacterized protein n=1 Tax=Rubrobacter tropicus TaxID=2653851 RepID=A0A6G8QBH5_9ACTN|nr:hypothetical protein [Rubrobacter tropicus]QIN83845.1 hypothetical protein GBA63_15265 [Rubrobacter tropicus]
MDRQPGERVGGGRRRAGTRASSGLALSVCLLCVGFASGSLILAVLNGRTLDEILVQEGILTVAVLTAAFSVVGALIVSHRPGNAIGWIFCAVGLFQGLANFGYEYATYALLTRPGSVPFGAPMSWVGNWTWAPGLGLVLVFLPLLFPDGRPPSRRWWWAGWIGGASVAVIAALAAVILWPERGPALLTPPTGEEGGPERALDVLVEYVAFPMMLVAGLAAVASLFVRFRRAGGVERQQIKWFAYAAAITLFWTFLIEGIPDSNPSFEAVTNTLGVLVVPSIPIAAGIAILRYRLYDIDLIINRTLVYAALTGTLVTVYVGSAVLLQYLFRALGGGESQFAIVASTLVIAALFGPLRRRIQALIDRRFYRKKYDAAKTLEAFSTRLKGETELEALAGGLAGVVRETVQPERVSLWLAPAPDGREGRGGDG